MASIGNQHGNYPGHYGGTAYRPGPSSAAASASAAAAAPFTFLFVVHEFDIDWERETLRDCWGNTCPPTTPEAYGHLIESSVMRWRNGRVERATEYRWHRQDQQTPGVLLATDVGGGEHGLDACQTVSIFECGWELPVCVVENDASVVVTEIQADWDTPPGTRWTPLHFLHPLQPPELRGVSQAVTMFGRDGLLGGRRYVAGSHASWIPSLVPEAYSTPPCEYQCQSKGLAGQLTIVLGLMAFCEERYCTDVVFLGGHNRQPLWSRGKWRGGVPKGRPARNEDNPRGFLVQVFLDSVYNPSGSTEDNLLRFQWEGVIVRDGT